MDKNLKTLFLITPFAVLLTVAAFILAPKPVNPLLGAQVSSLANTMTGSTSMALLNTWATALNGKPEVADFVGSTGITKTATGTFSFDCSEVDGTGINCSGENITLDATGDWTGTFDGSDGSVYMLVTNASSSFPTFTYASSTFPTFTYASSTFLTLAASTSLAYQSILSFPLAVGSSTHPAESDPVWLTASSSYILKSIGAAKGDLLTFSANDTPAIETVGANGTVLTASSTAANGLAWTTAGTGSGTVNTGTTSQIAYYASNGTAISGTSTISIGAGIDFYQYGNIQANLYPSKHFAIVTTGEELAFEVENSDLKTTMINASSTNLSVSTNSYLGTIKSGLWNGTAITNAYIASSTEFLLDVAWNGGSTGLVAATGRTSLGLGTMALEPNTGSTTITTLGTIGTGVWSGTSILNAKIASSTEYLADIGWNGSLVTNASTTNLSVATNSYVGTVKTGTWNGTAIGNTYGGTGLTAFTSGSLLYASAANTWAALASSTTGKILGIGATGFPAWQDDGFLVSANYTPTGAWDFGGATSLEIPNGAAMSLSAAGQIVIDTTSDQLRYFGAGTTTLMGTFDKSFWVGSTTPDKAGVSFGTATGTYELWNPRVAVGLTNLYCKTDVGTTTLQCGDGTNLTEAVVCSIGGAADDGSIANGTFTARENFTCSIGTKVGTPNKTTVTATFKYTAD